MYNLELLELTHTPTNRVLSDVKSFDQTGDYIYYINNGILHQCQVSTGAHTQVCAQTFHDVITLKFLNIEQKLCVVTSQTIYIVDLTSDNRVQSVDFVGLNAASVSWNPTEELLVVVSIAGTVTVFSVDYENAELFLQGESSVGAHVPDTVYVGWGSKDTQFRGSAGKIQPNAKPVSCEPVMDKALVISWRGNGEMFAVNYWIDGQRKFIVFENTGGSLYRSEDCSGLQSAIAWRPTGNIIATYTKTEEGLSVVVFEKNGQKRFSFSLDFGEVEIMAISWSPCAQILTITSRTPTTQNIHLLTCNNYKWYEKQRLTFAANNPLLHFDWLETTQFTYTLRAITPTRILTYTFRNIVTKFAAECAIIDGRHIKLTNFADNIIPLIASQYVADTLTNINFIAMNSDVIVTVDSAHNLAVFDRKLTKTDEIRLGELIDDLLEVPVAIHHFQLDVGVLYFVAETELSAVVYRLDFATGTVTFINSIPGPIRHLFILQQGLVVDGLTAVGGGVFVDFDISQRSAYQEVARYNGQIYRCLVTSSGHFYVNDVKVNDACNSFVVFGGYLLYTTKLNVLYCVRFAHGAWEDPRGTYQRSIEQGATLVTAIPKSPIIILQLPRGNLETISSRLISIDILNGYLAAQDWGEALRFIRLEKLNPNLLFDLDPVRFMSNLQKFVQSTRTVHELNSLVLEFDGGNVLETTYKYWENTEVFPGKLEAIFGGLLEYFDSSGYVAYITTIMVINLNFYTLGAALVYVQDLYRRSQDVKALRPKAVEAVQVLKTYGCDQEVLYTEALLLYDLELAHFVAACCQLDPRVYEPQLNNLKNVTELERRFAINVYAKKQAVAIIYLLRNPIVTTEDLAAFVTTHQVQSDAYRNCPRTSIHFKTVSQLFARELSQKGHHFEAGVVLKRGQLLREALEEFNLGLDWREVLNVLEELGDGGVEMKAQVLTGLARRLASNKRVQDAAFLYEFELNDYEMAVKVLIEDFCFKEALHVARRYNRTDIIGNEIIPVLIQHKANLEEELSNFDVIFKKHEGRLADVRKKKVNRFNGLDCEDGNELFSEAGSVITKSSGSSKSRLSTVSSRNRRKEEKKKQDLRAGGVYEDIALIRALFLTIKAVTDRKDDVHTCCTLLLQESSIDFNEIKNLHDLYVRITTSFKESLTVIWPSHFYVNNRTDDVQELADLENIGALDVEFRKPPAISDVPFLNIFKV